jgi:tetratricopeptide (TPR) repeat protein
MTSNPVKHARSIILLVVILFLGIAPAVAQPTGAVRGVVVNRDGLPISDATVELVSLDTAGARERPVTDMTGRFQQTGLLPGQYSVTAKKAELNGQILRILVLAGSSVDVHFVLEPGHTPAAWLRTLQNDRLATNAFEAGVRANRTGDHLGAIAQFLAVIEVLPSCVDCHFNIGVAYSRLERFNDAEAAYREALRIQSDYATAYYGLAELYAVQNRPEEAATARREATRISVNSMATNQAKARDSMNLGLGFLNSGNMENALRQFTIALSTDSTLVEAYYWRGRAYETSGDRDASILALSSYLSLAFNGEYANDASRRLAALER